MSSTLQLQGGSLRSRKIDHKKALPVLKHHDIPDLEEHASNNRITNTVSTGVEKEEEEEHHLQVALNSTAADQKFIPTPDASMVVDDYAVFYDQSWTQPKAYIRFSHQIDECIGCKYNVDAMDLEWVEKIKKKPDFPKDQEFREDELESIMANLERLANEKMMGVSPTMEEFEDFLAIEAPEVLELRAFFSLVYEWWNHRRFTLRGGKQISAQLKFEEPLGVDHDSYVCFRRREVRAMRKTRRCDTASLDKLRKLRDEMRRAREILELVSNREKLRKEILQVEIQVFEARIKVRQMKKLLGVATLNNDVDTSPEKSKKRTMRSGSTRIKIPLGRFRDSLLPNGLSPGEPASVGDRIKRRRLLDEKEGWADLTESPYIPQPSSHPGHDFWSTNLSISESSPLLPTSIFELSNIITQPVTSFRRRVGRGGRIIFDRYIRRSQWQPPDDDSSQEHGFTPDRWRFDCDDEDVEHTVTELEESARFTMYRAFNLAPGSEQECRSLMNKPQFPDQINTTPMNQVQRAQIQQQLAEKAAASPATSAVKRRTISRSSLASGSNETKPIKKKQPEPLNPRDAAVKRLLLDSQMQAAQAANQQLHTRPGLYNPKVMENGGTNGSPGANIPIALSKTTATTSSPKNSLNTGPSTAANHQPAQPRFFMQPNNRMSTGPASAQMQHQQQIFVQQQMMMQQQGMRRIIPDKDSTK